MSNINVTTFDGQIAPRKDCRYISGQFYIKNKHCFQMPDGKWHRINNGLIEFDYETQIWILKGSTRLENGVVGFEEDGKLILGSFSYNKLKNVNLITKNGMGFLVISEDIIPLELYKENLSDGHFYDKDISNNHKRKAIRNSYSFKLYYIFEHLYGLFKPIYDKVFSYSSNNKSFYKELNETTYGCELETWTGFIPERFCLKSGLIPLRDGSLRHEDIQPFEYTSIPLEGEKGLFTIKEYSRLLNKYCEKSLDCSLHLHIGNYGRSENYIVALYRLILSIQDDIYRLFPSLTKKTSKFKLSGKDYCNPLYNLKFDKDSNNNLKKIFEYYISGYTGEDFSETLEDISILHEADIKVNSIPPDYIPLKLRGKPQVKGEEVSSKPEVSSEPSIYDFMESFTYNSTIPKKATVKSTKRLYKESLFTDNNEWYIGMAHPEDPSDGDSKWRVENRYKIINLIPLLFGKRGTVEFRSHTITFNSDKIINWLFICNAICKYAFINQENISINGTSISLEKIIKDIYSKELSDYLVSYMKYREDLMKDNEKKGDSMGNMDISNDNLDKWNYPFKSLI